MKRYSHYRGAMREMPNGKWVRYSEATELLDALERAVRLLGVCYYGDQADAAKDDSDLAIIEDVLERYGEET